MDIGDIFIATVSLLLLLSITGEDTGPVDSEALPPVFGVKAATDAVSIVITNVANARTAADNSVLFVRLVLFMVKQL